jgi:hypothetical protein
MSAQSETGSESNYFFGFPSTPREEYAMIPVRWSASCPEARFHMPNNATPGYEYPPSVVALVVGSGAWF